MAGISTSLFFVSLMFLVPWSVSAGAVNSEAEVRAAVILFGEAFVEADISIIEGLLEENYIHINGSSGKVLDRDEWLRWVESRREELESGVLVVADYRIEDLTVEIYGEAAVVVGVAVSKGSRNGVPSDSQVRFTNVWVHRKDGWRRAAFHDTPLLEHRR